MISNFDKESLMMKGGVGMKSKFLILALAALGWQAKAEEKSSPDFPGMQAVGGLPRHQVARNLLQKRMAFNSCHQSLKARAGRSKGALSFEQARVVDSKSIQDTSVKPDGLINSTTFVKPANSTHVNISGEVIIHFSINPDGVTSDIRVGQSDIEDLIFKGCLETVISNHTFPSSSAPTRITFLVLTFSSDGYQSKD